MIISHSPLTLANAAEYGGTQHAQIRVLVRRWSRIVYLAMYCLIGVKKSVDAVGFFRHGSLAAADCGGTLRCCLACGVAALVIIRILAVVMAARCRTDRVARTPSTSRLPPLSDLRR